MIITMFATENPAKWLGQGLLAATAMVALSGGAAWGRGSAQDAAPAQAAKAQYNKVIGSVVSMAGDGSKITVKPDTGGAAVEVILDANTSYMQVPPGEKDLRKATRIEFKDLNEGDRVYARSRQTEGQAASPAVSVIVMSKTQLAQHQQAASDEWQKRGVAGKVLAVDPAAKTVTIRVQGASGPHPITVVTDSSTQFRRYSPDSVRFADAKKSGFSEVEPGNNMRVLGDRSEDGNSVHAEQVVSGSFRNVAGTVISVDPASHTLKLNDLLTKMPVTVVINDDTNMRRLPQNVATMIARASQNTAASAGTPGATPGNTARVGQGGPDSHPGFNGPGAPNAIAKDHPGAAETAAGTPGAQGSGYSGRRMDVNQILEHSPKVELTDVKPGDALLVNSTSGSDPARVTAVTLVAGVEPILASTPARTQGRGSSSDGGMWNLDMAMPQ